MRVLVEDVNGETRIAIVDQGKELVSGKGATAEEAAEWALKHLDRVRAAAIKRFKELNIYTEPRPDVRSRPEANNHVRKG